GRARGKDELLQLRFAQRFEEPLGGHDVVVDVAVEMAAPARTHAWLAREVEDDGGAVQDPCQVGVDEVYNFEREVRVRPRRAQVLLFAFPLVVVAERIDALDLVTVCEQLLAPVRTAEPSRAGYDNTSWRSS